MAPLKRTHPSGLSRLHPRTQYAAWRSLRTDMELLPLSEAAERASYSTSGLRKLIYSRKVIAYRFRGRWWVVWPLMRFLAPVSD